MNGHRDLLGLGEQLWQLGDVACYALRHPKMAKGLQELPRARKFFRNRGYNHGRRCVVS